MMVVMMIVDKGVGRTFDKQTRAESFTPSSSRKSRVSLVPFQAHPFIDRCQSSRNVPSPGLNVNETFATVPRRRHASRRKDTDAHETLAPMIPHTDADRQGSDFFDANR